MFRKSQCAPLWLLLLAIFSAPHASQAAAPANDNWVNRTMLTSASAPLPSEPNMYLATLEAGDPDPPCRAILAGPNPESNTLWYGYTTGASIEYLTLQIASDQNIAGAISVYTGTPGAFTIVSGGCAFYSQTTHNTTIAGLRLAPNTSYSIKVGATQAVPGLPIPFVLNFNSAAAAQSQVTKTADTNNAGCAVGDCSLREAIGASNLSPGAVLIPAGTYMLTLAGAGENDNATGDLDVQQGMGIYGAGMTQTVIDANHIDRVMRLDAKSHGYASFILGDLTLQNGNAASNGPSSFDRVGGALLLGQLNNNTNYFGLERVAVLSSAAAAGASDAGGSGGGLYLLAPGTIRDSVISGNTVGQYSGGGGGIYYSFDKTRYLEVTRSTISGNFADVPSSGGGIYAYGTLRIANSTVSGNHAGASGGGIESIFGKLLMANSTVVLNEAGFNGPGYIGGGLSLEGGPGNGTTTITNSIIANNKLSPIYNSGVQPDCAIGTGPYAQDPVVTSYNIVPFTGPPPKTCSFVGAGDVTVDPLVSPVLGYNGGLTPTHALLPDSPAIDAGDPVGCKDTFGALLITDQRGAQRPEGPHCDVGAFEFVDPIFQDGFDLPGA